MRIYASGSVALNFIGVNKNSFFYLVNRVRNNLNQLIAEFILKIRCNFYYAK